MVCLTMTSEMVEALITLNSFQVPGSDGEATRRETDDNKVTEGEQCEQAREAQEEDASKADQIEPSAASKDDEGSSNRLASEPSLADPRIGNPISHGQVLGIWRDLKSHDKSCPSLETLLQGSRVYIRPPPPKPEPVRLGSPLTLAL
ncbi:hypothetical protein ACMFMF_007484 [Clarireedia jacksonii]